MGGGDPRGGRRARAVARYPWRAARGFAKAERGCVRTDLGLEDSPHSTLKTHLAQLLFLVTGQWWPRRCGGSAKFSPRRMPTSSVGWGSNHRRVRLDPDHSSTAHQQAWGFLVTLADSLLLARGGADDALAGRSLAAGRVVVDGGR